MRKSVEASTQPCFTQLLIWKGSEVEPMKDVIILRSLGGGGGASPRLGEGEKTLFDD